MRAPVHLVWSRVLPIAGNSFACRIYTTAPRPIKQKQKELSQMYYLGKC